MFTSLLLVRDSLSSIDVAIQEAQWALKLTGELWDSHFREKSYKENTMGTSPCSQCRGLGDVDRLLCVLLSYPKKVRLEEF